MRLTSSCAAGRSGPPITHSVSRKACRMFAFGLCQCPRFQLSAVADLLHLGKWRMVKSCVRRQNDGAQIGWPVRMSQSFPIFWGNKFDPLVHGLRKLLQEVPHQREYHLGARRNQSSLDRNVVPAQVGGHEADRSQGKATIVSLLMCCHTGIEAPLLRFLNNVSPCQWPSLKTTDSTSFSKSFPFLAPDLSSSYLFNPSKHSDGSVGGTDSFEKQYFRPHVVHWAMLFRHAVAYLARVTRLP